MKDTENLKNKTILKKLKHSKGKTREQYLQ